MVSLLSVIMLLIALCSLVIAGSNEVKREWNMDDSSPPYFLDSGPNPYQSKERYEMHPLSMHVNATKRSFKNADQKYFARVFTKNLDQYCWISTGLDDPQTLKIWSSDPLIRRDTKPHPTMPLSQLREADYFALKIDKSPLSALMIPSYSKWEIVIDPIESKLELFRLGEDAFLNAVIPHKNEPLTETENIPPTSSPVHVIEDVKQHTVRPIKKSLVIATTSCLHQRFKRLRAFGAMSFEKPDIIILTGDNVHLDVMPYQYGCACCLNNDVVDNEQCWNICFHWFQKNVHLDLHEEYIRLLRHSDFPQCTDKWNPIWLATWNKHDYGLRDSKQNLEKIETKVAFTEFYQQLNSKQSWMQNNTDINDMEMDVARGIYHHYRHIEWILGEPMNVDFVILDVRYHRTRDDMLGPAQWKWLRELSQKIIFSKPHWLVFVLGTTFLVNNDAVGKEECWDIESRLRFERMLKWTGMPLNRIILISGNVHFSAVHDANGLEEFTVSSFTHSFGLLQRCCEMKQNEHAVSPIQYVDGYGLLKLTQNSWEFKLKDSNQQTYIPLDFTAQEMK